MLLNPTCRGTKWLSACACWTSDIDTPLTHCVLSFVWYCMLSEVALSVFFRCHILANQSQMILHAIKHISHHVYTSKHSLLCMHHLWFPIKVVSEPGIRRGNKDSGGNENWKSRKKNFFRVKTNWQAYFFFKQSVGVAESLEITPWTNESLPAESSVDGVVGGHLLISSYFRDGSIQPVLIGQKSLLNQWTLTLHLKLNGS